MREYNCDILIIGAGFAGAVLGFLLRKSGKDVLMLELRDVKEKDKLCGGMMSTDIVEVFDAVFGEGACNGLSPVRTDYMLERFLGYEKRTKESFLAMPRKRLDDYVLKRYLELEGRLMDRMAVREIDDARGMAVCDDMRSGERITVRYDRLVGADGAASVTRRLTTGRTQRVKITVEGVVPILGNEIVFEYLNEIVGYSWYIPWENEAVVGCGGMFENNDDGIRVIREKLSEFCRNMGIEAPKKLRGAPVPTGEDVLLLTGERTCFVGDAAGLINYTGAGIMYALRSALVLAESLCGSVSYEEAMRPYVEQVARGFTEAEKYLFLKGVIIIKTGKPVT